MKSLGDQVPKGDYWGVTGSYYWGVNQELLLSGYSGFFLDEEVLNMDSADGCTVI